VSYLELLKALKKAGAEKEEKESKSKVLEEAEERRGAEKAEKAEEAPLPTCPPPACDNCHWWGKRGERETHWDAAAQRWICSRCWSAGTATRYAFPWPDEIEGLGRRHIEAFTPCNSCGTGTWAFFGPWALCLRCANLGRAPLFWDREP
jgi:hypothetical protein